MVIVVLNNNFNYVDPVCKFCALGSALVGCKAIFAFFTRPATTVVLSGAWWSTLEPDSATTTYTLAELGNLQTQGRHATQQKKNSKLGILP